MRHCSGCSLLVSLWLVAVCNSMVANQNYMPQGSNPLLYTPRVDQVIQLDYATFSDTVFGGARAHLVEFYADWCGHCRSFAPVYREFAQLIAPWSSLVAVTAINCADPLNQQMCMQQNIWGYPMLKYYPRNARSASDAFELDTTQHSASALRAQVARAILNEYNKYRYTDWPNFSHVQVNGESRFGDLWGGVSPGANYLAIIFEQYDSVGGSFMLEMWSDRTRVGARRALASSPLVPMLHITQFPFVAVFSRNQQQAVFMDRYNSRTVEEVRRLIMPATPSVPVHTVVRVTPPHPVIATTPAPIINCDVNPQMCHDMFFVSEIDMLKAMRMALVDEVVKTSHFITNDNFTSLLNFVDLLSQHFPAHTHSRDLPEVHRRFRRAPAALNRSTRARHVFAHMREFLISHQSQKNISIGEWYNQFTRIEKVFDSPFAQNSSWEHCKGSSPQFRGYTCGLWTTFHALTVNAYLTANESTDPLSPLLAIKGWVGSFFGCLHCRRHFEHMTSKLFPMNQRRVRKPSDTMMYLWRAHNIVNRRLHNNPTEDPQFQKRQFPALFLCPSCQVGPMHFSRKQVQTYLLRFYGNIRPARISSGN